MTLASNPPITVSVILSASDGRRRVVNFDVNSLHRPSPLTADYAARALDATDRAMEPVEHSDLTADSAFLLECLRAGVRDALELYHRAENHEPPCDTIVPPESGAFPSAGAA